MNRAKRLADTVPLQNRLGRALISLLAETPETQSDSAINTFRSAVATAADQDVEENFMLLLETSFAVMDGTFASQLLQKRFSADCRININFSSALSKIHFVLFAKTGQNEIALTYSTHVQSASLEVPMLWLVWVLPLLVGVGTSPRTPTGMAFLNQWDAGILPGLSYCATGKEFHLIPDNVFLPSKGYRDLKRHLSSPLEWEKRLPIAFWRGASTGQVLDPTMGWRSLQRIRLSEMSLRHPDLIDAGISKIVQWPPAAVNDIQQSGLLKDGFPARELHQYRYLIDVDGNSNAWGGLFERLISGSPVLKVASPRGYEQWYYQRLRAWHNYVPVSSDMSDLVHKIEWLVENDAQAKLIGENGRALACSLDYDTEFNAAIDTVAAAFRAHAALRNSTGTKSVDVNPHRILTHHKTVLAYDSSSGKLTHVAPEFMLVSASLVPLILEEEDEKLFLSLVSGKRVIGIGATGDTRFAGDLDTQKSDDFIAERKVEDNRMFYSFRVGDRFMCAESDGNVTVSRKAASHWEWFRPEDTGMNHTGSREA